MRAKGEEDSNPWNEHDRTVIEASLRVTSEISYSSVSRTSARVGGGISARTVPYG